MRFGWGWLAWAALSIAAGLWLARMMEYDLLSCALYGLSVCFSSIIILLAIAELLQAWKSKEGRGWLLPLWLLAGLAFQAGLMFTSVRYVLFLAPPAILLVLKRMGRVPGGLLVVALTVNLILVLAIAEGDRRFAELHRQVVSERIQPILKDHPGQLYFSGHWGFQYYMEKIGGKAVEFDHLPVLKPGDLLVIALSAWPDVNTEGVPYRVEGKSRIELIRSPWCISTIDCASGANFYANRISGCTRPTLLPLGFGFAIEEHFSVYGFGGEHLQLAASPPR